MLFDAIGNRESDTETAIYEALRHYWPDEDASLQAEKARALAPVFEQMNEAYK